jgi:hypothetical protein
VKKNKSGHDRRLLSDAASNKEFKSVRSLFRTQYGCYSKNLAILKALIDRQLSPHFDSAVRAHVLSCEPCRKACHEVELVSAAKQRAAEIAEQLRDSLPPIERVRLALRNGAGTQAELRQQTKLASNELADALSCLMFQHHEVRSVITNGARLYFRNEPEVSLNDEEDQLAPRHPRQLMDDQQELAHRIVEGVSRRRRLG